MNPIPRLLARWRNWWLASTGSDELPIDGESGAWLVSLCVHFMALVLLATLAFIIPAENEFLLTSAPDEYEEQLLPEEIRFADAAQPEVGALGDSVLADAAAAAPELSEVSEVLQNLEVVSLVSEIEAVEIETPVLTSPNLNENMLVKGTGNVGSTGAEGAVDRITNEILLSLEQRPTLVVWLFDESGSLQPQRKAIAERFNRIYEELGVLEAAGNPAFRKDEDKPLLTSVASFEASTTVHLKQPTGDLAEIQAAMKAIEKKAAETLANQDLATGRENVFAAVSQMALEFRKYRAKAPQRNVMVVVFTDEAGNDYENVDAAVENCRKHEIPVYVVGVPAPFGRREALVKYVDPDPKYDQSPQFVSVDQGPESLMPERIKLRLFGQNDRDDRIESGFGPFALARLTYETGGIFFAVHPNREAKRMGEYVGRNQTDAMATHLAMFFDPLVMRSYRPDYISVSEYRDRLSSNMAKAALVQASKESWTEQMEDIRLRFPKVDEARLARDLSQAQRVAAKLEPKIARLTGILKQGESDRGKITEPRWQAGFDLAMGRALASKVRTEGYNAMLAQAKQGMKFENERNDTWRLRPSDKITTGSVLAKEADLAELYLQRVAQQHPGTPWSALAERELAVPFGWEWKEEFTNVIARMQRRNNGQARPQPNANTPPKKPKRPPPKL